MMLDGGISQAVKEVVPGAVTTAATITLLGIPLFQAAKEWVSDAWSAYSSDEIKEIEAVQKAYKIYCLPREREGDLTTLQISSEKERNNEKDVELPIILQMTEKNVPVLFEQGFAPHKEADDWIRRLNKLTPLKHLIEEMISYLCFYQLERDKRWTGGNYNYDPTNLFFEEFKYWLIELSKAKITDKAIEIVEGRRKYLNELYTKNIFIPGQDLPTRQLTILYIRDILEKGIKPLIELELSRKSAREHFYDLRLYVEAIIKNGVKFLFYGFRDTEDTPVSFVLEQIRNPTVPSYKKAVKTISGTLLQHLLQTRVFVLTLPPISSSQEMVEYFLEDLTSNNFIENHKPLFPFATNILHRCNWFLESKETKEKNPTGILKKFRQQKIMDKFLLFHGFLQKLCLFYIICGELFELSGDGGNLMLYGVALDKVKASLATYKFLIKDLREILNMLYQSSEAHKRSINEKPHSKTSQDEIWENLWQFANKARDDIETDIHETEKLVRSIQGQMDVIQNREYLCSIQQRLHFLSGLVTHFSEGQRLEPEAEMDRLGGENSYKLFKIQEKSSRLLSSPKINQNSNCITAGSLEKTEELDFEEIKKSAIVQYHEKNYEEALIQFVTLLNEEMEDSSNLYVYCADCCIALGNKELAIDYLTNLLEKEPEHQQALYRRAQLYRKKDELSLARNDLSKLLEINPYYKNAAVQKMEIVDLLAEAHKRSLTK